MRTKEKTNYVCRMLYIIYKLHFKIVKRALEDICYKREEEGT